MQKSYIEPANAYNAIKSEKIKYGTFHKTCFHIHTPESHDYCLLSEWGNITYLNKNPEDLFQVCCENKVFPEVMKMEDFDDSIIKGFEDRKQFFAFLLLANEIIANDISIIIVADHHTIKGVPKLKKAISYIYKLKKAKVYPEVVLGIEISCADRNHVVGIFDDTEEINSNINSWLEDHLLNEIDGSFETSKSVLEFIHTQGGVGYIAHIDTSHTFNKKYLSGAYKQKLFSEQSIIGISDINKVEYIRNKIKDYSSNEIKFILDNDSHCINEIGQKYMWIKGEKRNFNVLKEAINDYDISMSFENNTHYKSYIKGIYINYEDSGYLCGDESEKPFCMNFSDELNCFIGGRGTGKSTILELIEYVLSQRCKSEDTLEFLCSHGNTFILYEYQEKEYIIQMDMPIKGDLESILQRFGQNIEGQYKFYYYYNSKKVRDYALKHYLNIYSVVVNDGGDIVFNNVSNKRKLLNSFFDARYSVNELVNTASGEQINKFIYDILFENRTLSSPKSVIRIRSISGLYNMLSDVETALEKRANGVNAIIGPFNKTQKGILRIVYTQDKLAKEPSIRKWIWGEQFSEKQFYTVKGEKYNITNEGVEQYLLTLYSKVGIFEFLRIAIKRSITTAKRYVKILDYCETMNNKLVEHEVRQIDKDNSSTILANIYEQLVTSSNLHLILEYLKEYVSDVEHFSLEFNINNHESTELQGPKYRDVRRLSLGQKVVAMLSFILGYSDYSEDFRPLIIDQPEDNLDNQYIYKNLVKQIREVKGKRQVIIATHSATLVTNTKAEQVCVMKSDGNHGWIETRGFTGEKSIKKNIINYLEGGIDSFKHKLSIYDDVIKE